MTTPWERIEDDDYRTWLWKRQITAEEYNYASITDRSELRTQFDNTFEPTPKKVTVGKWTIAVREQYHLDSLLEKKLKVQSIVRNGIQCDKFDDLQDGGVYTLGPPRERQQQQEGAHRQNGQSY